MNQNDMDRYFWRTGQRWSGDDARSSAPHRRQGLRGRVIAALIVAYLGALTILSWLRLN